MRRTVIEILIDKPNTAGRDGPWRRDYPLGNAVNPWQLRGAAGCANV